MIRSLLALILLPLCALAGDEKKDKSPPVKLSADEKALLDLVNKARADKKLPPLKVHALLCRVAGQHCQNMARQEKMEHVLDGKGPLERVGDAGYDYRLAGENIAHTTDDKPMPATIRKWWMDSRPHRENILRPAFTDVGVSIQRSKKGIWYYTAVFGAPNK
jgi:uncharacterized protein YkwD